MITENLKQSIINQKKINREFIKNKNFNILGKRLNKKIKKSSLIVDKIYIQFINSLFELEREKIFFIKNYKYSLIYKNLVIEKFITRNEWTFVIHKKKDFLYFK